MYTIIPGLHLTDCKSIVLYLDGVKRDGHCAILKAVLTYRTDCARDLVAGEDISESAVLSTHVFGYSSKTDERKKGGS